MPTKCTRNPFFIWREREEKTVGRPTYPGENGKVLQLLKNRKTRWRRKILKSCTKNQGSAFISFGSGCFSLWLSKLHCTVPVHTYSYTVQCTGTVQIGTGKVFRCRNIREIKDWKIDRRSSKLNPVWFSVVLKLRNFDMTSTGIRIKIFFFLFQARSVSQSYLGQSYSQLPQQAYGLDQVP